MVVGERISERLTHVGLSQSELARCIGVAQGTIAHLISGRSQNSVHMPNIARELQTSIGYLNGETDDPSEGAQPVPTPALVAAQLDLVAIKEVDLSFGMGGTFLDGGAVEESVVHFPRTWLRQFTSADPSVLLFARGDGDSMATTINHRDIVLIDRSYINVTRQDRVWACAFGDIGMIKRIRAMPDGSYKIMSDNPAVESEIAVDGELHVIGMVVAVIRGI